MQNMQNNQLTCVLCSQQLVDFSFSPGDVLWQHSLQRGRNATMDHEIVPKPINRLILTEDIPKTKYNTSICIIYILCKIYAICTCALLFHGKSQETLCRLRSQGGLLWHDTCVQLHNGDTVQIIVHAWKWPRCSGIPFTLGHGGQRVLARPTTIWPGLNQPRIWVFIILYSFKHSNLKFYYIINII